MRLGPVWTRPGRRRTTVAVLVVFVTGIVWRVVDLLDDAAGPLRVTWDDGDGTAACVYDPATRSVGAALVATGGSQDTVTVAVTAYADENTSDPVGSVSTPVQIDGSRKQFRVSFAVERPPLVDIDGVTACRLEVVRAPG